MKYCSKKTLTHEEILFNYRLSRNRCVAKNVSGILISRSKIFASRGNLAPDKALVAVMAAIALRYTIF